MHLKLDCEATEGRSMQRSSVEAFVARLRDELSNGSSALLDRGESATESALQLLELPSLSEFLLNASRVEVFSADLAANFSSTSDELGVLRCIKLLKYSYNLPLGQLMLVLAQLVQYVDDGAADGGKDSVGVQLRALSDRLLEEPDAALLTKNWLLSKRHPRLRDIYAANAEWLQDNDQHALYPTSIYRSCNGHITTSDDQRRIEGVMGTTLTTTIEIVNDVLAPDSRQLRDIYKPLRRCVCVIDERVDGFFGGALRAYFDAHDIRLEKLSYRAMEVDKDISTVEQILFDLKHQKVSRNEPVLIVGGGVMADIGGFACALYHRNTPYVMLCTSIVSGIDAGPSPRTCSDGLGYKNLFGAYHPPILTLTDRAFFRTLEPGWIRHGIAEVVKMAVVKDISLFECLEHATDRLVSTKFGVEGEDVTPEFAELCDTILAKAMDCYVRSEYGNLWETHQCRPHAYGHTWSPGFEIQAGLLHGHAVSTGMGYGAYLALTEGYIREEEMHRVLRLISDLGLSLYHPVLEDTEQVWGAQVKMTEKRGGNLCAPVPKGQLGRCGYINDVSRERLERTLAEYRQVVQPYPRNGLGIEPHCRDVGLEDPSTVKVPESKPAPTSSGSGVAAAADGGGGAGASSDGGAAALSYNEWIERQQRGRNAAGEHKAATSSTLAANIAEEAPEDTDAPPAFDSGTLFLDNAEEYAMAMTSRPSDAVMRVVRRTREENMFAPCMVGQLEGQFLRMITRMCGARRVLDIGTFTGYSALAFAEALPAGGEVVTIEADAAVAAAAARSFDEAPAEVRARISLVRADARGEVERLARRDEKFDLVFLDADKLNYVHYYETVLPMLTERGALMADNALCALVYGDDDPAREALHKFNQHVRRDERVEQVMLTVREGILLVQRKAGTA